MLKFSPAFCEFCRILPLPRFIHPDQNGASVSNLASDCECCLFQAKFFSRLNLIGRGFLLRPPNDFLPVRGPNRNNGTLIADNFASASQAWSAERTKPKSIKH
jgi:hypothetical protein